MAQTEPGAINTWFVPSYRWEYGNLGEYHSGLMIYDEPLAHLFGFGYGRHNGELWIKTPLWFPTLLTAILPALVVWRRTSHAGRRRGASRVCTACGYDLRATPDRCPECGKEVAPRGA